MPRETGYFPFSADGVIAPVTDGTLSSEPTNAHTDIPGPTQMEQPMKNSGNIVDGGIGDTDYIFADKIAYGVFAGDS